MSGLANKEIKKKITHDEVGCGIDFRVEEKTMFST